MSDIAAERHYTTKRSRRYSHSDSEDKQDRSARRSGGDRSSDSRPRRRYSRERDHSPRRHRSDHERPRRRSRDKNLSGDSEANRRYRSRSRSRSRSREHSDRYRRHRRSRSPYARDLRSSSREARSRSPQWKRSRRPLPAQDETFRDDVVKPTDADGNPIVKQKANYKPTGLLAKEANTVAGTTTVLKYHEPAEARKPAPRDQWRMYVFKKKDLLDTVYLHQRSAWLLGRDQTVTDLPLEHPSISKQHAVIQFRYITTTNEFGDKLSKVKPYLIDLDSANGTKLNGKAIEASRYIELVDGDVVAFGESEREYVVMLPPPDKRPA